MSGPRFWNAVGAAKHHGAQAGVVSVLSGAPYGYRYIKKEEGAGAARFEIVLDEARVVHQVFQWVGQERATIGEVVARSNTALEHASEIRRVYGYRDFSDPGVSFTLAHWLYTRAWLSAEQPSVLFDLATAWLVERQVLLPGVSVLARLITRIRERPNARLYRRLASLPSAAQRDRLRQLLVVPAGGRRSPLDRLRRGPTQPTAAGLVDALRRLREARELGVDDLDLSNIPAGRLKVLARYASTARAQGIQRMPAERGMATLVAFACTLEANAQDDALDVLDRLLTDLLARVDKQERQRRLRTIGDLDTAALLFARYQSGRT
jgi:hypothetical protein